MADLEKRLDHIQYEEIKEIKETVSTMKIDMATNNLLTKQAVETSKELSATMSSVRETMLIMSENMKQGNKELSENMIALKDNIINLEDKVDSKFEDVNKRVSQIDNESKINVRVWLTKNAFSLATAISFLIYVIKDLVK